MAELEKQFKQNGGSFREFRIGDLFEVKSNPQLNKESFEFVENAPYPYFTRTCLNNGIAGYVKFLDDEHKIKGNSIAVGMLGMQFFYMERDFYAGQFTKTIYPKFETFNAKIALYFTAMLNKFQSIFQGILVRDFEKTFNQSLITLPTYPNNEIAFDFMESYIKELEEERIKELEAYLLATGLKDTQLTDKEKEALHLFAKLLDSSGGGVDTLSLPLETHYFDNTLYFKEFRIGDLFEIRPTKAYKMTNASLFKTKGNIPVVTNSSINNGISGYVGLKPTESGNKITYSDTTTSEGIFYQPRDFVGYSHIQGLYPLRFKDNWNKYTLLYMVGAFRKTSFGRFDYGNKFNRNIAKNLNITLPTYPNNKIAFDFMESLIKTIEKFRIDNLNTSWEQKLRAYQAMVKK